MSILAFFMQRLFLAGIIKNKYQKEYLAEMDKEGVLSYEYIQPKWLDKAPKFLKPYFESWGSYSIYLSAERLTLISCLEELSFFDNIKILDIGDQDAEKPIIQTETINIFRALSKIKNIEELSIHIDYLTPEHLKLIKHFKLQSLNLFSSIFKEGCLEIIGAMVSLKKLHLHSYLQPIIPEEVRYLSKLELESFVFDWGPNSWCFPATFDPIINNFEKSNSIKNLSLQISLSTFVKNIEKFPNLETVSVLWNSIKEDDELKVLSERKNLKFSELEIDFGVSPEALSYLSKINGLEYIDILYQHDLSHIDFSSFKNPLHISFPDYFKLKAFLKEHCDESLNISSIFCPGTHIDMETAKLMKSAGINGIFKEKNSLTKEVKKFLKKNKMFKNPNNFYVRHFDSKNSLNNSQSLKNAKKSGSEFLRITFSQLSKKDIEFLIDLKNLKSLNLSIESGLENINYLAKHEALKHLDLTFTTPPKQPIALNNIETLALHPSCEISFNSLIVAEKFNNLKNLSVYSGEYLKIDLSGIEKLKNLRELKLKGEFCFNGGSDKIHLQTFSYEANGCGILNNIVPVAGAEEFDISLAKASTEHFRALLPYAKSIGYLCLSGADLQENDFKLLTLFKNLESLELPFNERRIKFKDFRNILALPKLEYLAPGTQKILWKEYQQLTEEEKAKLE